MASQQQTIYFGRFIDTPTPTDLRVRTGAILVNAKDGTGKIQKADWTVTSANDAASKLGVKAPVMVAGNDGFFFPGFIGESREKERRVSYLVTYRD
jgi:hypothetical protein